VEKTNQAKIVSRYSKLVGAATAAMAYRSIPALGSFSIPKGLAYRPTGRSHLHAGHVRKIKKQQRRRAFFASLRK